MKELEVHNSFSGFTVDGGQTDKVLAAHRAKFDSESALDTALADIHKATDKPYLTINDKVYAARIKLGAPVAPNSLSSPPPPEPEPAPAPPPAPPGKTTT